MKLSGVISVLPGSTSTISIPSSTSVGHSRSANWHARKSVPSDIIGAIFLAPNASAKWPMNMLACWRGVFEDQADCGRTLEAFPVGVRGGGLAVAIDRIHRVLAVGHHVEIRLLAGIAVEVHREERRREVVEDVVHPRRVPHRIRVMRER